MELQVMILDDEYIILDGLCSFPWSDYGYQVAACKFCPNGTPILKLAVHPF